MKPIVEIIVLILNFYLYMIIGRVIYSWLYSFNVINSSNQFVNMVGKFLYDITEPALKPVYNLLYRRLNFPSGGIDLSPIALSLLVILLIRYLQTYVYPLVP
ncbi:MAG: YggT family protein [Methyloligellaceae bacterium]